MPIKYFGTAVTSFTPDTNAYTAGDVIGGLLTFRVGTESGGGAITRLLITDDDSQGAAGSLYLFNAAPTTFADNAAFAPVDADLTKLETVIPIPSFTTVNSRDWGESASILHVFQHGIGVLYGYYVTSGTPTYSASSTIQITLGITG